jgi:hypothetical protein
VSFKRVKGCSPLQGDLCSNAAKATPCQFHKGEFKYTLRFNISPIFARKKFYSMPETNKELAEAKEKLAEMKNILSALNFRHREQLKRLDDKFKKSVAKYEKSIKDQTEKVKQLSHK